MVQLTKFDQDVYYVCTVVLLPTGIEEHEVLQARSIHVAIFPSCQYLAIVHLKGLN